MYRRYELHTADVKTKGEIGREADSDMRKGNNDEFLVMTFGRLYSQVFKRRASMVRPTHEHEKVLENL
eukprot:1323800-Amorphochlora_amoeboformis.AAC.2